MLFLSRTPLASVLVLVGAALVACSASQATSSGRLCTPGAYVYCRCEDRSEGTKLCHDDGQAFDACMCDGTGTVNGDYPPPTDPDAGTLEPVDGAAPPGAPQIEAACAGKLGLIAGDGSDSYTYVLSYKGGGDFDAQKGHPGMRSNAEIVSVGSSLVATYAGTFSSILFTKLSGGAWSVPYAPFNQAATSAPALVAFNGGARAFFLGDDSKFHMATFGNSGWDDGTALGESATSGSGSIPGKSAPAAAAISTSITVAFTGNDGTLARETYSSSSFSGVSKFPSVSTLPGANPTVVALDAGAAKDYVMVYTGGDGVLRFTQRDSSSHSWNASTLVDAGALTSSSSDETSLVAMDGGKAMLVYRGIDNKAYYSVYDTTGGFSAPKPIGTPELAGAPAATRGHCGSDVSIAYAKADGPVEIMRFVSGAWTGPFPVGGITKATFVGIGEMP
jgi:hypothetical protein